MTIDQRGCDEQSINLVGPDVNQVSRADLALLLVRRSIICALKHLLLGCPASGGPGVLGAKEESPPSGACPLPGLHAISGCA